MFSIIFTCVEMKGDDYENKRMGFKIDILLHTVEQ
jgi:hypothetical protein